MQIAENTPRNKRRIGNETVGYEVLVPAPYVAGPHTLTEGEANALNQTVAENASNNLRKRFVEGVLEGEGDSATRRPFTAEEAQTALDAYLDEYEIGVRRAGSGERAVTDPVEREARKIARQKATALIKEQGGKPADYDMGPIVDAIFEANKELLMKEGKKLVDAAAKAKQNADGLDLSGVNLTPAPAEQPETETAE